MAEAWQRSEGAIPAVFVVAPKPKAKEGPKAKPYKRSNRTPAEREANVARWQVRKVRTLFWHTKQGFGRPPALNVVELSEEEARLR